MREPSQLPSKNIPNERHSWQQSRLADTRRERQQNQISGQKTVLHNQHNQLPSPRQRSQGQGLGQNLSSQKQGQGRGQNLSSQRQGQGLGQNLSLQRQGQMRSRRQRPRPGQSLRHISNRRIPQQRQRQMPSLRQGHKPRPKQGEVFSPSKGRISNIRRPLQPERKLRQNQLHMPLRNKDGRIPQNTMSKQKELSRSRQLPVSRQQKQRTQTSNISFYNNFAI